MTALELGRALVEMCKRGENREAKQRFYAADVVSVEPYPIPGSPRPAETRGIQDAIAKGEAFGANFELHHAQIEGPWPHGDQFIVRFTYDVTRRASGERLKLDEMALYTVAGDKIVREAFFYP